MTAHRRLIRTATLFVMTAALAACEDATGPDDSGVSGVVTAEIHDGASASSFAASRAQAASSYSGTAQGSAQVWIYSDARGWVELGPPRTATVAMQSNNATTVHGNASVPAGEYTRVRLVLDQFGAQIDGGAALGGLTLDASVTITMGGPDGRVEVEKDVQPFTVSAQSGTTVTFDLNSEAWVDESHAESRSAADAEISSATTAHVGS